MPEQITLSKEQVIAIRCAYADLVGAFQAMQQEDYWNYGNGFKDIKILI
jgi:hypothetical protein